MEGGDCCPSHPVWVGLSALQNDDAEEEAGLPSARPCIVDPTTAATCCGPQGDSATPSTRDRNHGSQSRVLILQPVISAAGL